MRYRDRMVRRDRRGVGRQSGQGGRLGAAAARPRRPGLRRPAGPHRSRSAGVRGESNAAVHEQVQEVRSEFVLSAAGTVVCSICGAGEPEPDRPARVEIVVDELEMLAASKTPPFFPEDELDVDETLASSTATSTCVARACSATCACATAWSRRCVATCGARDSSKSRLPSSRRARPKARATSSSPAACSRASSTLCRNRLNCSSSCS